MNKVIFDAATHTYKKGDEYTSVSRLIGQFKNEFNKDHWAAYKALERLIPNFKEFKSGMNIDSKAFIDHAKSQVDLDIFDEMKSQILKEWDIENQYSINKGNIYHLQKEQQAYINGVEINPFDNKEYKVGSKQETGNQKVAIVEDLYELRDGYYPELMLWNDEYKLAGQADKVFIETIRNRRYVDLGDHKTNKKIAKNGYKGQTMKAPLNHLQDCHLSHYSLQISTYGWLLEQFGFEVRDLSFHHFNKPYPVKYMSREVKLMLDATRK